MVNHSCRLTTHLSWRLPFASRLAKQLLFCSSRQGACVSPPPSLFQLLHVELCAGREGRSMGEIDLIWHKRMIISYWYMQSWRLRSPMVCTRQAGDPGRLVISSKAWRLQNWWYRFESEPKDLVNKSAEGRRSLFNSQAEQALNVPPDLSVLFGSSTDWRRATHWHTGLGVAPALLNPPIQMLISSRNTLVDTPGSNI